VARIACKYKGKVYTALGKLAIGSSTLSAEAAFNEEMCADGNMDGRIYPVRIIGASAMFLLSPTALRAARAVFGNR
jgi:hypothetical protein